MIKRLVLVSALALVAASCAGGNASDESRTVLVDWSSDEFASFAVANFPAELTVHPGMKVVFKQTWTGEPHTVTGGTLVDLEELAPLLEKYKDTPEPEIPEDAVAVFEKTMSKLPWAFAEDDQLNQTSAQPCYLPAGEEPPMDGKVCENQQQPAFDGTQTYYNSGIIPYEGPSGNTFEVQLAEDIEPGEYYFYCAVHGPTQRTLIEVVAEGTEIPSPDEVNRQARAEIATYEAPMRELMEDASDGSVKVTSAYTAKAPYSGLGADLGHAAINEFVPRELTVKPNEPITWSMMGADHTISFDVPEYFPIVQFEDDEVRMNPKIMPAAGGAPEFEGPDWDPSRSEAFAFDAGTYDGEGFWSSGLIGVYPALDYTLRISKPGTYKYACLIHPPMVGTIEVTA